MSLFPANSAGFGGVIDAQYQLFLSGANPILNFDANDFLQYVRSVNELNFWIGGTVPIIMQQTKFLFNGAIPILLSYTVATVPSAAANARGIIYVSDGTSNKRLAVSDGTNWRWPDGAIVS
jgi:hypothetical protein